MRGLWTTRGATSMPLKTHGIARWHVPGMPHVVHAGRVTASDTLRPSCWGTAGARYRTCSVVHVRSPACGPSGAPPTSPLSSIATREPDEPSALARCRSCRRQGTRMKSALPKVLHKIAGRSMLGHVLALAQRARADRRLPWSSGPAWRTCATRRCSTAPAAQVFVQEQRSAAPRMPCSPRARRWRSTTGDVLVLYADTPLLRRAHAAAAVAPSRRRCRRSPCSASRPQIRPATAGC